MLKSIKLAVLGLVATSLTLSLITPVNAVVSTTNSEPVVTEEENKTLVARYYRRDRRDRRYRRYHRYPRYRRYRRNRRYDNYWYPGDRRYRRYNRYRRYWGGRRCFHSFQYNRYGDRIRIRICP